MRTLASTCGALSLLTACSDGGKDDTGGATQYDNNPVYDGQDSDADTDSDSDTDSDADTDTDTDTDIDTADDCDMENEEVPDSSFGVRIPPNLNYDLRIRRMDPSGNPIEGSHCAIENDDLLNNDVTIDCMVDGAELNTRLLDFQYDLFGPAGACDYYTISDHVYESWTVGTGPALVSYTVTADGDITDEVNSIGGEPYCEFDYSSGEDPNCCLGSYDLVIDYEATGERTTETGISWSGECDYVECYHGAAFLGGANVANECGFPVTRYTYVNQASFSETLKYAAPYDVYYTNVPIANHYDPADHGGTKPNAYEDDLGLAREVYELGCVDIADEQYARIRLHVREFNHEDDFCTNGDPDRTGTEPVWGEPIDDYRDWATLTPNGTADPMGAD